MAISKTEQLCTVFSIKKPRFSRTIYRSLYCGRVICPRPPNADLYAAQCGAARYSVRTSLQSWRHKWGIELLVLLPVWSSWLQNAPSAATRCSIVITDCVGRTFLSAASDFDFLGTLSAVCSLRKVTMKVKSGTRVSAPYNLVNFDQSESCFCCILATEANFQPELQVPVARSKSGLVRVLTS